MKDQKPLELRVECTGKEANLRPAASALARAFKAISNPDGTFKDPELEAKYQEWLKENGKEEPQSWNSTEPSKPQWATRSASA